MVKARVEEIDLSKAKEEVKRLTEELAKLQKEMERLIAEVGNRNIGPEK